VKQPEEKGKDRCLFHPGYPCTQHPNSQGSVQLGQMPADMLIEVSSNLRYHWCGTL